MKSARNQLVLLGIICQSLSWDGYLLFFASIALWMFCVGIGTRRSFDVGPFGEIMLLVVGSLGGYFIGYLPGQSSHFFIGHGITLLQAGRLLRGGGLTKRDSMFVIIAAMVQLGVACTVVLDYRFIPILLLSAFLIPRALMELEAYQFPESTRSCRPSVGWKGGFMILLTMITFFLVFPRGLLSSVFGGFRPPSGDSGSLLDSIMDPSRSALMGSSRMIMQVEGENIGYMRSFALVIYDKSKWLPDRSPGMRPIQHVAEAERVNYVKRSVRVKEVQYLGKSLPTDGRVVALYGKFFRRPLQSYHENIECEAIWNTSNSIYDYWIDPNPPLESMPRRYSRLLSEKPEVSDRLQAWLDKELEGIESPLEQARYLESYFHNNFVYELGGPELSRLNSLDEFMFDQRRGHCERYASAMALLLRLRGIPSRVLVGYAPGEPHWMTGWQSVRARDAHAWTEAYFEGVGWVEFDATPRASMDLSTSAFREFLDALDVAWYVNIVNFDVPMQTGLFNGIFQRVLKFPSWAGHNPGSVLMLALAIGLFLAWRFGWKLNWSRRAGGDERKRAQVLAEHYYGQLLRSLARQGIDREPHQTPLEFLRELRGRALPSFDAIQMVTNIFCSTRYGNAHISPEEETRVKQALEEVKKAAQ